MSEEKNNIDQLFNDAAHNQKAPEYSSAYWAEMNALLNARAAKRRGLLLWTSIGVIFCLFLLTTLFVFNMNEGDVRVQYAQNQLDLKSNKIPAIKEGADINSSRKHLDNNNGQSNTAINQVQENTSLAPAQNKMTQNTRGQNKTSHYNSSQNNVNQRTVSRNSVSQNTKTQPSINQKTKGNSSTEESLIANHSSATKNKPDEDRTASNYKIDYIEDQQPINKRTYINKEGSNDKASKDIDLDNVLEDNLSLPVGSAKQLSQNNPGDLIDQKVKHNSKTQLSLYAKLSGGLMENYKTARPYQSGLVDFSLNLEARFNSILLRTGIGTQYTTHADLIVSQRAKVYGFGVMSQQNDLSYQDLLDIYIPIEFGYQLKSTSFGIGVQANYLLTTSMNFNTYEDQILTHTEKYYGNTNGLRPFSTQGYVWVEQKLFSRFSIGLKIGTNISGRIKDGKYFNRSATINPIYGQLTFRLNIL